MPYPILYIHSFPTQKQGHVHQSELGDYATAGIIPAGYLANIVVISVSNKRWDPYQIDLGMLVQ
jgi:hypothetical protein